MVDASIHILTPHKRQIEFIESKAKRKVIRAGRRSGKTVGIAIYAVEKFLEGKRVLYAAPTQEQIDRFWHEVTLALDEPIELGIYYKNETRHVIELPKTEQRIRAKTAWNADTLRGDYADVLILDEWQLMSESAWEEVGAPMLLDNNGVAVFIYTPPSLVHAATSRAKDPQHAAKMYKMAESRYKRDIEEGKEPRWEVFHFTSHDNPYISDEALAEIVIDMTSLAYQQEIMAEDVDQAPGALFNRVNMDKYRVYDVPDEFDLIVVGVDPSATSTGDEAGIVAVGKKDDHVFILDDRSIQGSPFRWGSEAIATYHKYKANRLVAESNNGGEMVSLTIHTVDKLVPVDLVHASRGKQTRAEPVAAIAEQGRLHMVGSHPALENEMAQWQPGIGMDSPNRCFVAGTMITTERGLVPIEKVKVGDRVLTRSGYRDVVKSGVTGESEDVLSLTLRCGTSLTCTMDHPIYVSGKGFVTARSIGKGDRLMVIDSAATVMTKLKLVPGVVRGLSDAGKARVYNLEVDGEHEYFANGVLVHNCDAMVWAVTSLAVGMSGPGQKEWLEALKKRQAIESGAVEVDDLLASLMK